MSDLTQITTNIERHQEKWIRAHAELQGISFAEAVRIILDFGILEVQDLQNDDEARSYEVVMEEMDA